MKKTIFILILVLFAVFVSAATLIQTVEVCEEEFYDVTDFIYGTCFDEWNYTVVECDGENKSCELGVITHNKTRTCPIGQKTYTRSRGVVCKDSGEVTVNLDETIGFDNGKCSRVGSQVHCEVSFDSSGGGCDNDGDGVCEDGESDCQIYDVNETGVFMVQESKTELI